MSSEMINLILYYASGSCITIAEGIGRAKETDIDFDLCDRMTRTSRFSLLGGNLVLSEMSTGLPWEPGGQTIGDVLGGWKTLPSWEFQ